MEIEEAGYSFSQSAEEEAEKRGLVVVYPKSNELFVDIDTLEQSELFIKRFDEIYAIKGNLVFDDMSYHTILSSSGFPHNHIVVSLFKNGEPVPLTDWMRMALQFALGSDPIKETLSVYRILAGIERPSLLFEKPEHQGV